MSGQDWQMPVYIYMWIALCEGLLLSLFTFV